MEPEATVCNVAIPALLDASSLANLLAALQQANQAPAPVIVLRGTIDGFCRGMRLAVADRDASLALSTFVQCLAGIRLSGKATVAVVEGETLGGGVGLAAACDLVLATTTATFGLSELLLGLSPATIFPLLAERVGTQRGRLMALAGCSFTAQQCQAFGLIDVVVSPIEMAPSLKRWLHLLSRAEPGARAAFKKFTADPLALEANMSAGAALTTTALTRPEVATRIAAFEAGDAPWVTP